VLLACMPYTPGISSLTTRRILSIKKKKAVLAFFTRTDSMCAAGGAAPLAMPCGVWFQMLLSAIDQHSRFPWHTHMQGQCIQQSAHSLNLQAMHSQM